jgi:hypothetical protein
MGFLAAIVVIALPAAAIGLCVAPALGDDDATRALALPAGLCLLLVPLELLTGLGLGGWWLAAAPLASGAVAAAVAVRRRTPVAWALPPLASAVGALLVFAYPFHVIAGRGVLGWNIENDSTVHAVVAEYIASGRHRTVPGSAFGQAAQSYGIGYPAGSHELLAAVMPLSSNVTLVYDPVLAVILSFTAFGAYWLLRRSAVGRPLATLGAVVAAAGYLQLEFYGFGYMPQMAATPMVLASVGLGYEAARSRRLLPALLCGATAAAAAATYSLYIVGFMLPAVGIAAVGALLLAGDRAALARSLAWQVGAVVVGAAVVLGPVLGRTINFARGATGVVKSTTISGDLVAAVDPRTIFGAWIGPDYRIAAVDPKHTDWAFAAGASLLVVALVAALVRRRPALPLVLLSYGIATYVIKSHSSIYYTSKAYQMLAIPVACGIVAGAAALLEGVAGQQRIVAGSLVVVLLGGWGVAVKRSLDDAARSLPITPPVLQELFAARAVTGDAPGFSTINDDWVKVALPDVADPFDHGTQGQPPAPVAGRGMGVYTDFDSYDPAGEAGAQVYVEPRLGGYSVPPPPWRLVRETESIRVWRRPADDPPGGARIPLEPAGVLGGRTLAPGATLTLPAAAGDAPLLGGGPQDGVFTSPVRWNLKGTAWDVWTADPRFAISVHGGGPARWRFAVADAGRYDVSLIGRPDGLTVQVDGHPLPPPAYGQLDSTRVVGTVPLDAGEHTLSLVQTPDVIAYVQGVSVDRSGTAPPAPVCVGDRRLEVAPSRPVRLPLNGTRTIRNCGRAPLWLDWVEPGGTAS